MRYIWEDGTDEENEEVFNHLKQKFIEMYRFVTTSSDEDFKAHFEDYFVKESILYYYLFTHRYTMCDNRSKNFFLGYSKTGILNDDGLPQRRFHLSFNYDNDKIYVVTKLSLIYGENPMGRTTPSNHIFTNRRVALTIVDGKEYFGIIYKIKNKITGEVYIGQTTNKRGFNGRYLFSGTGIERVHKYLLGNQRRGESHNQHLRRSIEKFGYDAFEVTEVLDTAMSRKELNEKEIYYIELYDCYKHGYNQSFGGDGQSGYARPKGKDCKNSKRICQIDMNNNLVKIWDSATEAAEHLNISQTTISQICNGRKSKNGRNKITVGGYIWRFEKDYDPNEDYVYAKTHQNNGEKPVVLLDDNNVVIQEFPSVVLAGEALGIKKQEVSRICKHKAKTIKFNLMYKSEYMEEQRLSVREFCEKAS